MNDDGKMMGGPMGNETQKNSQWDTMGENSGKRWKHDGKIEVTSTGRMFGSLDRLLLLLLDW